MLDGLVSEETKDGSMMTTGMTPNPLSAFAMSSSSDAAASTTATIDVEKRQHCFNDDDDDDCGGEEGSPNNPIDVPMRISIPPSIPVHMGNSSSSTGVGLAVLPNPVIMSSSFAASSIDVNSMRYCHVEVPSPLDSPTYTCCDDVESKTTTIDNHSFPASSPWPHSLTNAARSSSVGTSASTVHAMAKVLAGGSGSGNCGGAVDENDVGEAACAGNNEDDVKVDDRKGIATAAIRPDESYAAATFPSAEGFDAGSAMMMMRMPNNLHPGTDCNNDQAAIFDENHRSQPEKPQDQHHPQQQQQEQQQDGAQQRARIQSPASPPPPSTDMVRSFSFPAVGGGAAYGSIMMSGAHSSSGSLYSEHTAMSHSETDSPSNENSWRNGSSGNPDANIAKALTTEGDGGGNEGTTETQHHVMSDSSVPAMPRAQVHFRKNYTTTSSISIAEPVPSSSSALQAPHHPPADKRQKRLERNRESARVSRRRRKFYLEELECKVTKLSEEMDRGRMKHACAALPSLRNARAAVLNDLERCIAVYPITTTTPNPLSTIHHNITTVVPSPGPNNALQQQHRHYPPTVNVDGATPLFAQQLSRTNDELQIVQIFMKQQLASLVQPILTKFVLWLSLQNEEYYRGGRSASERLSAARIGERLLHRGTRRAAPESGLMWPLICHEISLSYEQEEKVRTVQRLILSNVDSWIQRHTALATRNVMESIHEVISGGHAAVKSRERNVMELLTPEQRVIFLVWARRNGEVIRRLAEAKVRSGAVVSRRLWMDTGRGAAIGAGGEMTMECGDNEYMTSPDRHVAANLYVINHLLSKIKQRQRQKCISATSNMFVHPMQLKKLSRRPSFESLAGLQAYEDSQISKKLSREASFPSTGSLKRSLNDMSLEGSHSDLHSINSFQDATVNGITPVSAQSAGQAAVLAVLSDVMPIVPKAAWINPLIMATSAVLPSGNIATGGTSMSVGPDVTHVTSQPPPQAFIPAPSVTHPPKRRHTDLQSPPIQQSVAKASNWGVGNYQHQQNHHQQQQTERPPHSDIPDVDDIPMPTPVSVLLRTSDDYFSLFEPHEPSSTLGYDTSHHELPFTTINNSTLLSSRHRSAPQLATFSRWGSSSAHPTLQTAHMAVIPESEPVSVDVGVDFFTPDQSTAVPHVTNTDSILGNSHQSAPQLYAEQSPTFLSGSLITNSAMMPQTNDVISPGNDQLIEEFARLEGLPLNMEADDWAIGEGFDMDF